MWEERTPTEYMLRVLLDTPAGNREIRLVIYKDDVYGWFACVADLKASKATHWQSGMKSVNEAKTVASRLLGEYIRYLESVFNQQKLLA